MNRRAFLVRSSVAAAAGAWMSPRILAAAVAAAPATSAAPPPGAAPAAAPTGAPAGVPLAPKIEFHALRGDVGCAFGRGGTIGYLVKPDVLTVVDSGFPDVARMFLEGLPGRAGRGLDLLINTHHHPDHTNGNGTFRPHTRSILAHAEVPALQRSRSRNPDAEVVAETLFTGEWRRDCGSEQILARHYGPAHTKGDIAVYFEKANVAHLGDLMFNRRYPVMDRAGGHTTKGWIAALEKIVKDFPADTLFIFGHAGPKAEVTGSAADVNLFRDYLSAVLAHVEKEKQAGRTKEEIVTLQVFPGFPEHAPTGPQSGLPSNLGAIYDELAAGGGGA